MVAQRRVLPAPGGPKTRILVPVLAATALVLKICILGSFAHVHITGSDSPEDTDKAKAGLRRINGPCEATRSHRKQRQSGSGIAVAKLSCQIKQFFTGLLQFIFGHLN